MSNTIRIKRGSGSNPSASDLAVGELAIRTDTGVLFSKDDGGSVITVGGGGGVSDGDYGDITVSNSGATFTIDNNVVSLAKLADINVNQIIGRLSSGSGDPEALNPSQIRSIINVENGATADQTASDIKTLFNSSGLANAQIDGSAAIAGSKISPSFTSDITITNSAPSIALVDTDSNSDFSIFGSQGEFRIRDQTNTTNRLTIASDGTTTIAGNTDFSAGIDVTGNITVSGTVDGRDLATDGSKLDGIESGATADQTASEILTLIKTVDGAGSGLDADTLDGVSSASFLRSDASDSSTQPITFSGGGGAATIGGNSDIRFSNGNWTGESCKIQQHGNYLYIAGGSNGIFLRDDNAGNRWLMDSSGHFRPSTDSSFDIGSNSDRVRNGYFDNLYGSGANLTSIPYSALTSTPTIPTNNNQLTNGAGYITSATNNFVSSASFNTGNGVLTLNRSGLGTVTVDLDGRFATGTIPTNNNQLSNGRGFVTANQNTTGFARTLENSRTGSAPNYALRAWVNFKGTGSVSVRSSGNVSSISDFGQGNYRVNFSTSMADSNYATTTIGAYDKTNSLAPFIIFSQGGFGSNPIQYNSSGVRCGSTYGDFHIATLMFAR